MLGSLQFVELERLSIYTFVPEPFTRYRTEFTYLFISINSAVLYLNL